MNQQSFVQEATLPETVSMYTTTMDAVTFLHSQPRQSVDLIVTDPAYESLEKYRNIGTTTRLKKEWFAIFPNHRYSEFFSACYLALKPNAHCYVMCDEETLFIIKPIAEQCGFKFWKSITWNKMKMGMGYHWRNQTERVAFFEKGKRKLNDLSLPDIIEVPAIRNGYPTEKPIDLYKPIIKNSSNPGEIVVDPFFGSGNGLLAANELGRHALGSDISDTAHSYLNKRPKNIEE